MIHETLVVKPMYELCIVMSSYAIIPNMICLIYLMYNMIMSAGYQNWVSVKTKIGETARLMNHQINDQSSLSS